jgi:transcriptional regulator with XRE-family HTH domain
MRRNMLGLSQGKLGEKIGLTFQQVQKYERGANRISASRLLELAQILDVPIAFFYDDVDPVRARAIPEGFSEPELAANEGDHLSRPETAELIAAYYEISYPKTRRRLFELAKALSEIGVISSEVAASPQQRRMRAARTPRKPSYVTKRAI